MKVLIKREQFSKLLAYAKLCKSELGGMGKITMTDDGKLSIESVYLVKQHANGTTCELDAEALGLLEFQTKDEVGELALWWHSHAGMGVNPSSQDIETMNKMGANGRCLMLIINNKGETHAEYTFAGDASKLIPAATIKLNVDVVDSGIDTKAIKAEIAEKVLEFAPPVTTKTWGNTQHDLASDETMNLFAEQWEQRRQAVMEKRKAAASLHKQSKHIRSAKGFIISPQAFEVIDSLYGIRLSSGYSFAQSRFHRDTIYICSTDSGVTYSIPFAEYVAATNDDRQSVKDLVK